MLLSAILFRYVSPILASLAIVLNAAAIFAMTKKTKVSPNLKGLRSKPHAGIREKNGQSAKCTDILISLAASDLIVGLTNVLAKIIFAISMSYDHHVLAVAFLFFKDAGLCISLVSSLANLFLLSSLRLFAIMRPVKYSIITSKQITRLCAVIWALIIIVSIIAFTIDYIIDPDVFLHSYFLIPLVSVGTAFFIICYYLIWKLNRGRGRLLSNRKIKTKQTGAKIFKLGMFTVVAFVICWIPVTVYFIIVQISFDEYYDRTILNFFYILVFFNSVVNPVLYFVVFYKK